MAKAQTHIGSGDVSRCPIPKTHRRLIEAHVLWHQTLQQYHQPEFFHANLNATIQALRNVTFVLQAEKAAITNFEQWYAPWQELLRANPLLKWLKEARNIVVKQGELELNSTAVVKLVTWRDDILIESIVPPTIPPSLILRNLPLLELINNSKVSPGDAKNAAVVIERCWRVPDWPDREILDVLAEAYGVLSNLVLDAHVILRESGCISSESDHPDFPSAHHRTGMLGCMLLGAEDRVHKFELSTGQELNTAGVKPAQPTAQQLASAVRRYALKKNNRIAQWQESDPIIFAEHVLHNAKRILRKDRYHHRMMFIRDGLGHWHLTGVNAANRTEKHLLLRMIARFIESVGADALIDVGEAWVVRSPKTAQVIDVDRLSEHPLREEVLQVLVATRDGTVRIYMTPFKRGTFGGIKLADTITFDEEYQPFYLTPVFDVWLKQSAFSSVEGKRTRRVWKPDPLDRCFCARPRRFAECCEPFLKSENKRDHIERDIDSAMAIRDFSTAEDLARAALAQYVIWVRQHTAPTMNVAPELHRQLVEFDVPALDAHVRRLGELVIANGTSHSFAEELRYLSKVAHVPAVSLRFIALASQWFVELGDYTSAIGELEKLGDVENVNDTLALLLATKLFDYPPAQKKEYLTRAISHAYSDGERLYAQLELVRHFLSSAELEEALKHVDSVIAVSKSSVFNRGALANALAYRWRITRNEEDFKAAQDELQVFSDSGHEHMLASILIEHGNFDEVERIFSDAATLGDPVAQLVTLDARLRANRKEGAREMLLNIDAEALSAHLHYPYAVACAYVALACSDRELKAVAVARLRRLPSQSSEAAKHTNHC